jgi:hypothetical protein
MNRRHACYPLPLSLLLTYELEFFRYKYANDEEIDAYIQVSVSDGIANAVEFLVLVGFKD